LDYVATRRWTRKGNGRYLFYADIILVKKKGIPAKVINEKCKYKKGMENNKHNNIFDYKKR